MISSHTRCPWAFLLTAALLAGCQAPRDNPWDPASPHYQPPQAPGRIADLAFDSLDGLRCRLVWTAPAGAQRYLLFSALPDWDGADTTGARRYDGELPAPKPSGARQAAWVELPANQTRGWALFSLSAEGLLSAASNIAVVPAPRYDRPAEVSVSAVSIVTAQWSGADRLELEIAAAIADSDTVSHVWWTIEDETDTWTLSGQGDGLHWFKRFRESDLPDGSLESLVGHALILHHVDRAGFISSGTPFGLARVIDRTPEWLSPLPDDTLDTPRPRLEWLDFAARYPFTYAIEIWHVPAASPNQPQLLFQREAISADSTALSVDVDLIPAPLFLYWTVAAVDEFGDRSLSLESKFFIRGDD